MEPHFNDDIEHGLMEPHFNDDIEHGLTEPILKEMGDNRFQDTENHDLLSNRHHEGDFQDNEVDVILNHSVFDRDTHNICEDPNGIDFHAELANTAYSLNERGLSSDNLISNINNNPLLKDHFNKDGIIYSCKDFAFIKENDSNTTHILVRGTDPEIRDIYNDIQLGLGLNPRRSKTIMSHLESISESHPELNFICEGHSLGGTLCEKITEFRPDIKSYTFNSGRSLKDHFIHPSECNPNIFPKVVIGDFISANGSGNPGCGVKMFDAANDKKHTIFNFINNGDSKNLSEHF